MLVVMNLIHLGQVNQLPILEVHLPLVLVLLQSPLMHLVFFLAPLCSPLVHLALVVVMVKFLPLNLL
jgi:hypothetical protein